MKRSAAILAAVVAAFLFGFATRAYTFERHPEMAAAERALDNALNHLEHGAHDFGGHRVKAMQLTRSAIAEVQESYRFDR